MEQTEGVNFVSDTVYLAKMQPGPEKYEPKADLIKPRTSICRFNPSQGKKDWRPKKTKDPDPGSYEVRKGQEFVGKAELKLRFAAPRGEHVTPKVTFTTESTRRKKFVPGVGSYNPKIDYVAVPYGRKRGG